MQGGNPRRAHCCPPPPHFHAPICSCLRRLSLVDCLCGGGVGAGGGGGGGDEDSRGLWQVPQLRRCLSPTKHVRRVLCWIC